MIYANKAAVEAAVIGPSETRIETLDFADVGDGGGARYIRSDREPDHAGRIQSADGAWWEIAEDELTPEMFGARRNNADDDSPAINAALMLGRPVRLRDGIYRIANTVLLTQENAVLTGSRKAVITFASTLASAIRIRASRCHLRGFKLQGDTKPAQAMPSGPQRGIYCNETTYHNSSESDTQAPNYGTIESRNVVTDLVLEDLEIVNIHGAGIRLDYVERSRIHGNTVGYCLSHGIMLNVSSDNDISHNFVDMIGPGLIESGSTAPYFTAYGISINRDPARSPYATQTGTTIGTEFSRRNRITDNTVKRVPSWNGIDSHGCRDLVIANNTVERCHLGIHLEDGDWARAVPRVPHPGHAITIVGNAVTGVGGEFNWGSVTYTYGVGAGINADGGASNARQHQIQIVGNRIYGCGVDSTGIHAAAGNTGGIRVQNVEACQIVGNTLDQCRRYGIWLGPSCAGVTVTGNTVQNVVEAGTGGSAQHRYAVWLANTTASCLLDGNFFYGAAGMYGYGGVGGYSGDYGYMVGANRKIGSMVLVG